MDQLSFYVQTLHLTPFLIPLVAYWSGYTFSFKRLYRLDCICCHYHPHHSKEEEEEEEKENKEDEEEKQE
jgi:hypothetical protein